VLIAVESRGGRTRAKAEESAAQLRRHGTRVAVAPLAETGPAQIAWADLVVVGTWVEGAVVAGVRPARAARQWVKRMPPLGETPVAVFCTYGFHPRGALAELRRALAGKGGVVVAEAAFGPRTGDSVDGFASAFLRAG
jgi:menaquinone-dependent protoporphyrinogen IX oxidase